MKRTAILLAAFLTVLAPGPAQAENVFTRTFLDDAAQAQAVAPVGDQAAKAYTLGAGDKLRIVLYGENDISGEYEIDGSGQISLPLVGEVAATGMSARALEQKLTELYSDGYFVDPRVSIEVTTFRPFFILGEVNNPGDYNYINNMTVLQAVTVAGGYTYRAKKSKFKVTRIVDGRETELTLQEADSIMPGDVIHIAERFF